MQTAQLAILVSGAVGLGAPTLTAMFAWLREKETAKRDRGTKDLEDLRALLDELLPVMFEHTTLLVSWEEWMRDRTTGQQASESHPPLDTRKALYAGNARLVIRLGRNDDLVVILGRYLKSVDEAVDHITTIDWERDVFDKTDEQLAQRAAAYWAAYEAFADACKTIIGSVVSRA